MGGMKNYGKAKTILLWNHAINVYDYHIIYGNHSVCFFLSSIIRSFKNHTQIIRLP